MQSAQNEPNQKNKNQKIIIKNVQHNQTIYMSENLHNPVKLRGGDPGPRATTFHFPFPVLEKITYKNSTQKVRARKGQTPSWNDITSSNQEKDEVTEGW